MHFWFNKELRKSTNVEFLRLGRPPPPPSQRKLELRKLIYEIQRSDTRDDLTEAYEEREPSDL